MNSIISLPKLIDLLAKASSKDRALCERFVKAFSSEVGEALGSSGSVKLKGFGQFRVVSYDGIRRIVFVPEKDMADAVNAPFVCFEPVELAPGVDEEVLSSVDDDMSDSVSANIIIGQADEAITDTIYEEPEDSADQPAQLSIDFVQEEIVAEATPTPEVPADDVPDQESLDEEEAAPESVEIDFGIEIPVISTDEELTDVTQEEKDIKSEAEMPELSESPQPSDTNGPSEIIGVDDKAETPTYDDIPSQPWATARTEEDIPVQAGLDLLTPEARQRLQTQPYKKKTKTEVSGFPWFWVAVAYVGGMAIGFALGFFGHDYLKGQSDEDDTIDLSTPANVGSTDEVIDLTVTDDELLYSEMDDSLQQPEVNVPTGVSDTISTTVAKEDSIVAPQLGQAPVYDTITPKNNLNTLALKHYGNKVYWVYIFLDNQDKIKNPNNVIVGTKLRIPPKAQYDVSDSDEKANIDAALRKQSEIYTRFGLQ